MVFSWKETRKCNIKHARIRVQIYLKNGLTMEAAVLKRKIDRFEKE